MTSSSASSRAGAGAGPHVVLVGLMASGKSTVGRLLAARLGRSFVDNDDALLARTGRSARDIAATEGAGVLHEQEAATLVAALAGPEPAVIAAAAAAPLDPAAAAALAAADVVYLRAAPEVLAARIERGHDDGHDDGHDNGHRPFVDRDAPGVLAAQFAERDERYRSLAGSVVDAAAEPAANVDEIVRRITPAPGR